MYIYINANIILTGIGIRRECTNLLLPSGECLHHVVVTTGENGAFSLRHLDQTMATHNHTSSPTLSSR